MTYGSYLGTIYDLNFFFFMLNKLYIIQLIERYMFNNNKTIETLQRHVGPFMLILLLLSSLVCLSRFLFDMYFYTVTWFFKLVLF